MAKFTDYTQKTKPADADLLLIHDNAGAANKKTPFSGVWSWILDKLASAVISQLETTNKSIIPAINELNSKSARVYKSQTTLNLPVLKITPLKQSGEFFSFVNRNSRKDIYVFLNGQTININAETVYGSDYTVKSDESSIYIVVNANTVNFIFASVECVVASVESAPE